MRLIPLLLLLPSLAFSQTSVLFIGNSYIYSNDLPNTFRQLALSMGEEVTVASSAPGGYQLFQHSTYTPTLNAIAERDWDFVVLQEQSQIGALPLEVTNMEFGATALVEAIEENFECTYPVYYMTWGRQNGDELNCPNFPYMCTYNGMQQGLRDNYVALAEATDGYTAAVGAAWKNVRDSYPSINLYVADGSHPSVEGTYLAACVFYCTLFQESCAAATFNSSLPAETAAILRNVASTTVLNEPLTWNLDAANGTSALLDGATVGPDWITLIHNGEGTHLWTCTNGETFTTSTVTFTFTTPGIYQVTHTYNDPCGNTDTVTLTFDIALSMNELTSARLHRVFATTEGNITVEGARAGDSFRLYDPQGRLLQTKRISGETFTFRGPSGLHLWRITEPDGRASAGRVLVH